MNVRNDAVMQFLHAHDCRPSSNLVLHPTDVGATTLLAGVANSLLASLCSRHPDRPLEKPVLVVCVSSLTVDIQVHMQRLVEHGSASDGTAWLDKSELLSFTNRQQDSVRVESIHLKSTIEGDGIAVAKAVFNEIRSRLDLSQWQPNVSAILLDGLTSLTPMPQSPTEQLHVFISKFFKHLVLRFLRFGTENSCPIWMTSHLSGEASRLSPLIGPSPRASLDCRYLSEKFDRTFVLGNPNQDRWLRLDDRSKTNPNTRTLVVRRNDTSWFDVADAERYARFFQGDQKTRPLAAVGSQEASILKAMADQHEISLQEDQNRRSLTI